MINQFINFTSEVEVYSNCLLVRQSYRLENMQGMAKMKFDSQMNVMIIRSKYLLNRSISEKLQFAFFQGFEVFLPIKGYFLHIYIILYLFLQNCIHSSSLIYLTRDISSKSAKGYSRLKLEYHSYIGWVKPKIFNRICGGNMFHFHRKSNKNSLLSCLGNNKID